MFLKNGLLLIIALALLAFVGQASAGPNANAVLSLDIDASDNKMDDGNTSGTVAGAGTDVVVEVFISGLAGPISGGQLSFDTDVLTIKSVAVGDVGVSQGLSFGNTAKTANIGVLPPANLTNGHLATVTFTTASDVTGMEFTVGASMNLAASGGGTDMLTAAMPLTFNAMPPTTTPPPMGSGPALDIGSNGMNDGNTSVSAQPGDEVSVEVFTGMASPISGAQITFSQAIASMNLADGIDTLGVQDFSTGKVNLAAEVKEDNGGISTTLNEDGYLGTFKFVLANVPTTVSVTEFIVVSPSGISSTLDVANLRVMFTQVSLTKGETTPPQPGSETQTVTATGFAADADIRFSVMPEDAPVTFSQDGATATLTATGAGTVNVTVTASVGDLSTSLPLTFEIPPPVLTYTKPNPDKIPRGGSSMVTVTAMGFAADADIRFNVMPEGAPVTKSEDGATATLTATDATTVTVTATDGTTTSDPVSIEFQRAPYLMASDTLALVYEDSSTTVTVTAMHFPAVMFVPSIKNSEGEVTITQEGNVYTLTSNGQATVMVTATDATNPDISDTIEITFRNAPKLMADANMVLVHRDSSVNTAMATVTATGFPADAEIEFNVMPEGAVTKSEDGATATLTAMDATTVTVTATDGEVTTSPVSIEFQLDPYLEVDKVSPVVIPPGDSAVVKVTALDYPDGAEIDFEVVDADVRNTANVKQADAGNVLTLTVSGSGSARVIAIATDGTKTKTATIQFIQPPELTVSGTLSDSLITIPLVDGEAGSVEGLVTASHFPADAALKFSAEIQTEDAAEVDTTSSGADLTLIASGSGSATVMVSVSSGKYEHLIADPITLQFIHPRLVADEDSLIILPDSTAVATITAKDFPAEDEVKFDLRKEADESVTVEQAISDRKVVLTARGSGSATVTVMASSGEITAAPAVIQFDQPAPIDPPDPPGPQPALMADADEYVIPPDGDVMATITAINFPKDAKITFNLVKVDAEGPEVTIDEMASQGKLTLTASGSGTATVEVKATDGATSVADTIRFIQPSLMLVSDAEDKTVTVILSDTEGEITQVMIPHNGSGMVMVTAEGSLPAGAMVAFAVTPEDAVEWTPDGDTLTLTSNSEATVTVTASAAEGEITAEPITVQFIEYQPRLESSADSVVIPSDGNVMVMVTAVDFPADAEITFDVGVDADGSTKVEHSQEGADLTLTASGSGSATVIVMASSGSGEGEITASATIQFVPSTPPGPQPALMSDADEYVIPPNGNVMATITAMNFPEGAKIAFNWAKVETDGPEVTIDEMEEGAVLTLTASGSGTATVEVKATDGATSVADTIRFIQPSLMLVSDAEDKTVTVILSDTEGEITQVMIPHNGSGMVMVTAEGPLPTGAVVAFAVTPEDAVELARDGATLTLTSNSAATVTVTASAAEGEIVADQITVQFIEPRPRLESLVGDAVVIPLEGSAVAMVAAVDFPADAEITFNVNVQGDADGSTKVEHSQEGADLTLTASGSGSATVVVTASSGEGEITASATIRFVQARLVSDSDSDANEYVIPPDGSVVATVTAEGFPNGITYSWVRVETDSLVTIDEMEEDAVLTLTASGSGAVTVMVKGTGGGITREIMLQFIQPPLPDPPDLSVDREVSDEIVSLPRGGIPAIVRVTAENFPADAELTFEVDIVGGAATVEHSDDGSVLTLEVTGPGAAIVKVMVTDGTTTVEKIIQFDEQVAVELSSFVGEVVEERVVLNWVTASQTNNAGFRVLRSTDRENYEVVSDLIAGAGTTDQLMDYTFEDASLPAVERVYYVLEQIDIDGTVHRSNPVEVMLGARFLLPTEFSSFVYPNPFNPSTTISYDLPSDADVSIVIYDAIGQEIRQLVSEYRAAGRYSVRWDATDHRGRSVGSGVYIAKIKAGQHTALQKMLLLK